MVAVSRIADKFCDLADKFCDLTSAHIHTCGHVCMLIICTYKLNGLNKFNKKIEMCTTTYAYLMKFESCIM